jgi:hypothetical protein
MYHYHVYGKQDKFKFLIRKGRKVIYRTPFAMVNRNTCENLAKLIIKDFNNGGKKEFEKGLKGE